MKHDGQWYRETRFADFRELINHSAAHYGRRTAFAIKTADGWLRQISYREFRQRYYALCARLAADGLRGARIAVTGPNCYEWVLAYVAAATVGVAVPLDRELQAADIANFVRSADCRAVCLADGMAQDLLPALPHGLRVYRFSGLEEGSGEPTPAEVAAIDGIFIAPDRMQVLIFTSGTTGSVKGVCLSQFAICSDIYSTVRAVKIRPQDVTLSVLPLHHTYECTLNCLLPLSRGAKITYCEGLTKIQKNIVEYSPTVLVVVPALLGVLSRRICHSVARECPKRYRPLFEAGRLAGAMAAVPFPLRRLIRARVGKSLGGRLRLMIVGAADLDPALVEDFASLGIRTLQGYGLTECAPLLAGNNDFYLNPRSTGIAMPGIQLKIDRPNAEGVGEILARGGL